LYVSPLQINYIIPSGAVSGALSVVVTSGDGTVSTGTVQVSAVAPAIFTADSSGSGVPAASLPRRTVNGSQIYEGLSQFDLASNRFRTIPIDLGPQGEHVFLILYLCGVRHAAANAVSVVIGGNAVSPVFTGPAPGFTGLDQINVE